MKKMKWIAVAILLLLVISPIDLIFDGIPIVGWLDDLAYIVGAIKIARSPITARMISAERLT